MFDRQRIVALGGMRADAELHLYIRPDRAPQLSTDKLHPVTDAQYRQLALLRYLKTPEIGPCAYRGRRWQILGQVADQSALYARTACYQQPIDTFEHRLERCPRNRHRQHQRRAAGSFDRFYIATIERLLSACS
jgi:hypothetical protein